MEINLDLSSLKKSVDSLMIALDELVKRPGDKFVRDATIQRFEYTYEMCGKMIKRYLELTEPNIDEIENMTFANLIRTASERGLLENGWDVWSTYRHARNLTSHTYDEKKADEVCNVIPGFRNDAAFLLMELQRRVAK